MPNQAGGSAKWSTRVESSWWQQTVPLIKSSKQSNDRVERCIWNPLKTRCIWKTKSLTKLKETRCHVIPINNRKRLARQSYHKANTKKQKNCTFFFYLLWDIYQCKFCSSSPASWTRMNPFRPACSPAGAPALEIGHGPAAHRGKDLRLCGQSTAPPWEFAYKL